MNQALETNIERAKKSLSQHNKCAHFDLELDESDISAFNQARINVRANYNHLGTGKNLIAELKQFFEKLGNDSILSKKLAKTVQNICTNSLDALHQEAAWITIRASKPHSAYNTPRWHIDGNFYQTEAGQDQYKIALGLKGAKTLFNDLSDDKIDRFVDMLLLSSMHCDEDMGLRENIASLFDEKATHCAGQNQGSIFLVGDKHKAAPHSEPPFKEDRLFLSIVPGSKKQISTVEQQLNL